VTHHYLSLTYREERKKKRKGIRKRDPPGTANIMMNENRENAIVGRKRGEEKRRKRGPVCVYLQGAHGKKGVERRKGDGLQ